MSFQFHETGYGKAFFGHQLPQLIRALTRIADCLEASQKPLRHDPPEVEDGSLKQYRLNITEIHYGSVGVGATSRAQAIGLSQEAIDAGRVSWHKTELGDVSAACEP